MKLGDMPEIMQKYLVYMQKVRVKSDLTVKEYGYDLMLFYRYFDILENEEKLKSITLSDVHDYMIYLADVKKNKAATRSRKISSLKSFYKYLHVVIGYIEVNPMVKMEKPKREKRLPIYMTLDESVKLLDSIEGHHKIRDYAIVSIFLNCGIRLSELTGLNVADIHDREMTIIGKGDKQREVYLNDTCKKAIDDYLQQRKYLGLDHEALFLSSRKKRIVNKSVQQLLEKHLDAAGLSGRKLSPHKLRHTAATLMYQNGTDIRVLKEILGHESISTTEIYTHINNKQMINAIKNNPLNYR